MTGNWQIYLTIGGLIGSTIAFRVAVWHLRSEKTVNRYDIAATAAITVAMAALLTLVWPAALLMVITAFALKLMVRER